MVMSTAIPQTTISFTPIDRDLRPDARVICNVERSLTNPPLHFEVTLHRKDNLQKKAHTRDPAKLGSPTSNFFPSVTPAASLTTCSSVARYSK